MPDAWMQLATAACAQNLHRYPDMISYVAGGHVGGWRGRGERPSLWRSRRRPWCSGSAPPAFHLPGWCQPLADTTTANICGPNQGRAVTPTGVERGSGSAGQRSGMAAAADTGPLPVHPEAFASLTCMLINEVTGRVNKCSRMGILFYIPTINIQQRFSPPQRVEKL
jgi:hypothetical protein